MIGRAYVYGLGASGQEGVAHAIEIIRDQLDVSMALTGMTSVKNVGREILAKA
jgi:L-lactate dehydrogenase (cytochrome)